MAERIALFVCVGLVPGARSGEPELLPQEPLALLRDLDRVAFEHSRQGVHAKLHAAHGSRRKQRPPLVPELARVVLDDREKVLRNRRGCEQLGGPDTALSGARGDVARHGRDEQRHALRALVQSPHRTLVFRDGRQPLGEIRRDLRLGERIEHDLLAETVQTKLVAQSVERMIASNDLGEPEARQPHDTGAAAPPREEFDELDRRPIAPMQVFRDQQQRPILRVAIEEFAHLPEHPLRGCADELLAQRFALLGGAEPRQLQQPGRRDRAQQRRNVRGSSAKLRKCLEHGWNGSPDPYCCTHWPRTQATSPRPAAKCSMSVVLPIPGSPAAQAITRAPLLARSQAL